MKRPSNAKRSEVVTNSAAVVDKMLLDNFAEEIVYYNDAVTVTIPPFQPPDPIRDPDRRCEIVSKC